MAHAAGIRHGAAERLRFGRQQFVRVAVAQGTIGRAFVAALTGLAVYAKGVVAGLFGMAGRAIRLGNIGGMGIPVVGIVTDFAGQPFVRALGQLRPLVVAGRAIRGGIRGAKIGAGRSKKQAQQGGTEPQAQAGECPVRHR